MNSNKQTRYICEPSNSTMKAAGARTPQMQCASRKKSAAKTFGRHALLSMTGLILGAILAGGAAFGVSTAQAASRTDAVNEEQAEAIAESKRPAKESTNTENPVEKKTEAEEKTEYALLNSEDLSELANARANTPDASPSSTEQNAVDSSEPAALALSSADMPAFSTSSSAHTHLWLPTTKTVHHNAVTKRVDHSPIYVTNTTYHTVCNECKAQIDGMATAHIADTGHSGYTTNVPVQETVMQSAAWTENIVLEDAWNETVQDGAICATCGEWMPA